MGKKALCCVGGCGCCVRVYDIREDFLSHHHRHQTDSEMLLTFVKKASLDTKIRPDLEFEI